MNSRNTYLLVAVGLALWSAPAVARAETAKREKELVARSDARALAAAVAAVTPPSMTATTACQRAGKSAGLTALATAAQAFDAHVLTIRQLRHQFDTAEKVGAKLVEIDDGGAGDSLTVYPAIDAPMTKAAATACAALPTKPSRAQLAKATLSLHDLTTTAAATLLGMRMAYESLTVACVVACFGPEDGSACFHTLDGQVNPYGRYVDD